jgi:hypothetical protein
MPADQTTVAYRLTVQPVAGELSGEELENQVQEAAEAAVEELRKRKEPAPLAVRSELSGEFLGLGEATIILAVVLPVAGALAKSFAQAFARAVGSRLGKTAGEAFAELLEAQLRKRELIVSKAEVEDDGQRGDPTAE